MNKYIVIMVVLCMIFLSLVSCERQSERSELTDVLTLSETTETSALPDSSQETDSSQPQETLESENMSLAARVEACFDRQRTYKPTLEDVDKINVGMEMPQVIEHLGKPHSFGAGLGSGTMVVWEMADGSICWIILGPPADRRLGLTALDFLEGGIVMIKPTVTYEEVYREYLR